eukprot:tig00000405_g488.t1
MEVRARRRAASASPDPGGTRGEWQPRKSSPIVRYIVLALSCMLVLGPYNAYDSIGSVQSALQADLGISDAQFSYLYSIYSVPNVFLVPVGGLLLDRAGLRPATLGFAAFAAAGACLVLAAPYRRSYPLMLLGRLLFGVGSESSFVAQNSIIATWFGSHHSEIGLAMGLGTSAGRLGTFLAFRGTASLLKAAGTYKAALWMGAALCVASFAAAAAFWGGETAGLLADPEAAGGGGGGGGGGAQQRRRLRRFLACFPASFWLAACVATLYYSCVFPFQAFSGRLLQRSRGYSLAHADSVTSVIPLASLLLSPPLGLLVDRCGHRARLVAGGTLLLFPRSPPSPSPPPRPCPWPAPAPAPPPPPPPPRPRPRPAPAPARTPAASSPGTDAGAQYCVIGLVFALVPAALWPSLPILVPPEHIGAAFGIVSSLINAGLMASYAAAGALHGGTLLGAPLEAAFFAGAALAAAAAAAALAAADAAAGGALNRP